MGIFEFINDTISNAISSFLMDGISGVIAAISPLVLISVTIYIMGQGYIQLFGSSNDSMLNVIKHCLIVACITALALNVSSYTTYVIGVVESVASGLSSAVSGQSQDSNVYQTLDELLNKAVEQAGYSFGQVGLDPSSWTWFLIGLIILASITSITLISAVIIIGTKFLLTILFALGPLFLVLACFPITKRFLDSWIAKLIENIFVQVLGVMTVTLAIKIIEYILTTNDVNSGGNPVLIAVNVVIISGIMFYVIRQIPNLSGALAGGFASASMSFKDLKAGANAGVNSLKSVGTGINKFKGNEPSERSQRDTWEQQQANKIKGGSSNASVAPSVMRQIDKHNQQNK